MCRLFGCTLILGLCVATSANAEMSPKKEICLTISTMAQNVMSMRQIGMPITEPLTISQKFADDGTASGAETSELMDGIIMDAYSNDLRYSEQMKMTSVNEFATKYYLICMQNN